MNTATYAGNWQEPLTLHLTFEEATFLARQIETRVPQSLLGQILMDDTIRTTFVGLPDNWSFAEFCDSSPPFIDKLSMELRRTLFGARDFWHILKGAHLPAVVLGRLQAEEGIEDEKGRANDPILLGSEWQCMARSRPDRQLQHGSWEVTPRLPMHA